MFSFYSNSLLQSQIKISLPVNILLSFLRPILTMELCSFDIPLYEKILKTKEIGKKIIYKDVTETTMDDAEKAALSGNKR